MNLSELKLKSVLGLALIIGGLTACSDTNNGENPDSTEGKKLTISAESTATTRVVITPGEYIADGIYGKDEIKWVATDKLQLFFYDEDGQSSGNKVFDIDGATITPDGSKASFSATGSNIPANNTYESVYAVFLPAGVVIWDEGKSTVREVALGQTQNGRTITHLRPYMWAKSDNSVTIEDGKFANGSKVNLNFKHLTAMLRVNIKNTLNENIVVEYVGIGVLSLIDPSINYTAFWSERINVDEDGKITQNLATTRHFLDITNGGDVEPEETFDAYMSSFPTNLTNAESLPDNYGITVRFRTTGGALYNNTYYFPLADMDDDGMLKAGKSYVFEVDLSEPQTESATPIAKPNLIVGSGANERTYRTQAYIIDGNEVRIMMDILRNPVLALPHQDNLGVPYESVNGYGYYYAFKDAEQVCPPGWRLPVSSEIEFFVDNINPYPNNQVYEMWTTGNMNGTARYYENHDYGDGTTGPAIFRSYNYTGAADNNPRTFYIYRNDLVPTNPQSMRYSASAGIFSVSYSPHVAIPADQPEASSIRCVEDY